MAENVVPVEAWEFIVQSEKAMQALCAPLFDDLEFGYFAHRRAFPDNTSSVLTTNTAVLAAYYTQGKRLFVDPAWLSDGDLFFIPNRIDNPDFLKEFFDFLREHFNLGAAAIYVEQTDRYYDLYYMGLRADAKPLNTAYLTNISMLKHFIAYFQDKGADLITEAAKHRFVITPPPSLDEHAPFLVRQILSHRKDFVSSTPVDHYFLKNYPSTTYFTQREVDCVRGLMNGKSAKEIARELELSDRTVESYIRNVKEKLNVSHKSDVVRIFFENGFTQ